MNKKEIIKVISDKTLVKQSDLQVIIDVLLKEIKKNLEVGKKIKLQDFGTFLIQERKARTALDPRNQEVINVPAKKVVKFKPSKELYNMVNK